MVSFDFGPGNLSLPISFFVVSLKRLTGRPQKICKIFHDERDVRRDYEKKLFQDPFGDDYIMFFTQKFLGLEENSLYTVTVTAMFNSFGANERRATSMMFETPAAGKIIIIYARAWALPLLCSVKLVATQGSQ